MKTFATEHLGGDTERSVDGATGERSWWAVRRFVRKGLPTDALPTPSTRRPTGSADRPSTGY
ncbi:hypothetical protein [Halosimplex pelagicum]|uniref:Uncharacterized protein n=1 Tax=Halosimplex pelagicum TaxID=869886 RepID=A0A7D5PE78_9EURY|nr:hypothetical protein [Halosimplex pelagicum]QLH81179.1 hypothetical protein HZS54_05780 [Halosimplex pelagicum]